MKRIMVLVVTMVSVLGWAQEEVSAPKVVSVDNTPVPQAEEMEAEEELSVTFGGEVRLRYEAYNFMPTPSHGQGDHTDYLRVRTRLWGKVTAGKLEGFLRLGDEFRYYRSQSSDRGNRRFPDVLFIDQLYLKYSDVWGVMDVKVGRQEFLFGSGRIFADLTGGDGSRSNFADGVRLTFKPDKARTLEAFAFYVNREDWLPTAGHRHDARSKDTKSYDYDLTGYNHDELGAGFYYTDKRCAELPWEAYYVFKAELDGTSAENTSKAIPAGEDSFLTHTVGVRLLPQFSETVSGELELAAQLGDDDLFAMMAYGGLTYAPEMALQPQFTAAVQYWSGDRDGARGKHAWHAVFDRDTLIGELPGGMFPCYALHNALYPHLKVVLTPAEFHTLCAHTGPIFAPTAEKDPAGGEYGHFRGYFVQAKYSVALGKYFDNAYARGLNASLLGEYMSKGDAFVSGERNDAFFLRLELTSRF